MVAGRGSPGRPWANRQRAVFGVKGDCELGLGCGLDGGAGWAFPLSESQRRKKALKFYRSLNVKNLQFQNSRTPGCHATRRQLPSMGPNSFPHPQITLGAQGACQLSCKESKPTTPKPTELNCSQNPCFSAFCATTFEGVTLAALAPTVAACGLHF